MKKTVLICILGCIITISPLWSKSYFTFKADNSNFSVSENCYQKISDTLTSFWLCHSNRMYVGNPFSSFDAFPLDEEINFDIPFQFNASFPGHSDIEYLHASGLWVGGIKGNDTLVSHAFDYVAPIPELNPVNCPDDGITRQSRIADFEYLSRACDTFLVGDTLFRCLVGDCNDWRPLGIEVKSHMYRWLSPPLDKTAIIEYTIVNIDTLPLEQGWVGIYADCDIGRADSMTEFDDVSGFIGGAVNSQGEWKDLNLAYSIDLDGEPENSVFPDYSARGGFGVQILGLDIPEYRVNYNWWTEGPEISDKTAPRRNEAELRNIGGEYIALGDSNHYYLLSHAEIDYNQIEGGINHSGWLSQGSNGMQAALGGDTRFLISAGPFDLAVGDSVTFTIAYLVGDGVITNPFVNTWFASYYPLSIADYYETLDFSELTSGAIAVQELYENGFEFAPPGPPDNVHIVDYSSDSVSIRFNKKIGTDIAGYQIYSSFDSLEWTFEEESLSAADTVVSIFGLAADSLYYLAVSAVDSSHVIGRHSKLLRVIPKAPHPPASLWGNGRKAYPSLIWSSSVDDNIEGYKVYRKGNDSTHFTLIVNVTDTAFIDFSAKAGVEYKYCVTAYSDSLESAYASPEVTIVPLPMTSGILAVDYNSSNMLDNLLFDRAYFRELVDSGLSEFSHSYIEISAGDDFTLLEIADYSLVVLSAENRGGDIDYRLETILRKYMENGGKLVLLLRHAARDVESQSESQIIIHRPGSLLRDVFKIDSSLIGPTVVQNGYQIWGDCYGAVPLDSISSLLTWDSLKINSFGYSAPCGIPYCGYFWPTDEVAACYNYSSLEVDSFHTRISGIKHISDGFSFYLLNFPLSLMEIDSAATVLRNIIYDLGAETLCGDINVDFRVNIGDVVAYIRYLYYSENPLGIENNGDLNCDGAYDLQDVLILINYFMANGLAPPCCEEGGVK
ncbi:MAG: hypothetical protein KAR42_11810 [candidate division Zixibacteria bacterium]|nr:hypothetical protein [candidate division Zixibacteria bacterium]